jgi:hypothetical protein
MTTEIQLEQLREKSRATNVAIGQSREEVVRCVREVGEIRICAALDTTSSPKEIEARCKKLDAQRAAAQSEVERLMVDVTAIDAAIERTEAEFLPKRHAARLERQERIRDDYRSIASRHLEAVNLVSELSNRAKALFDRAGSEIPANESFEGQSQVHRQAGLKVIWDPHWIIYGIEGSQRDHFVSRIFDFDRSLVASTDRVVLLRLHAEEHHRKECERHEREQKQWQEYTAKQHRSDLVTF